MSLIDEISDEQLTAVVQAVAAADREKYQCKKCGGSKVATLHGAYIANLCGCGGGRTLCWCGESFSWEDGHPPSAFCRFAPELSKEERIAVGLP